MLNKILEVIFGRVHRHRHHLGLIVIVIPMALLTVYYLLVATDRYVSEAKVVVKRSATDSGAQFAGISIPLLGGVGGTSNEDAMQLKEFIQSADLLAILDKRLALRKAFELKGLDIVNMLPPWATREDFLKLYRKRVEVEFDDVAGVLTVRTQGETPEFAQQFNQAIIQEAEKFINELSQRISREELAFANQELVRARKGLDDAKERLLGYQNQNAVLDPNISAEVTSRVIADLEAQLANKEVELVALGGMLQEGAAQIVALRQAIASIKQQIAAEKQKLTSPQRTALNRAAAQYIDYKAMVDFQADVYKISLGAYEKTRVEAVRKVRTLAVISSPQLAEEAEFPKRGYMLAAWLFGLCLLFGLVKLTIEIIEDHRD